MDEKDPLSYDLIVYLWVLLLASIGGLVNFMRKLKAGAIHPFSFTELIGELITSAFTGVITFYLCEWAGTPQLLTAALVGISGHMGSRGLFMLENILKSKFPGAKNE